MSPEPRRLRIDLAYDGTNYRGWQVQPAAPTVQGVLESALSKIEGGRVVKVRGAGRTDAGVHARGQVADAQVLLRLADAQVLTALRAILPGDVRPLSVTTVGERFHARRDAVKKTYRYRLDRSEGGSPFLARYALHHARSLDLAAVEDALERLRGRRDFSGFAASSCEIEDRVRDLTEACVESGSGGVITFAFCADGFLTHMLRIVVGTLLEIGRGRFRPERIDEILATRDRRLAGPTAPAHALCLEQIVYPSGPASGGSVSWPIVQ